MATDFDAAARTWDSPDKVDRARVLAGAIADAVPLSPDLTAVEVGCGTGQLSWQLGERVGHVTLIDVSRGMLEVARQRAASAPDRYTVREHDLTTQPLEVRVDVGYSAMTLHHVPDTAALLANLRDSLTPGGWVALADLDADPDNHFHGDDFTGHHGIDRHDVVRQLRALGFEDVAETTATTITREKDGVPHTHDVFLVTGRLPR